MDSAIKEDLANYPIQKCIAGEDIHNLPDYELLAVVLGTGMRNKGVLELASELVSSFGGISGIYYAGIRELSRKKGVGLKKAIRIHAAFEMGRRIRARAALFWTIDSPKKVWELLLPDITGLQQEEFRVLVLNNKNRLIKKKVVSVGTVSEAIVHPRELFRDAIRETGSSIIIAHNHPSGFLLPSKEDIETTRRIHEAGKIIGIALLDHVILGETAYLSMKEAGYL